MSAVLKVQGPSAQYIEAVRPALIEHFELVGSAPGGVARLRELILTLAVRGKLVPQDPSDESASVFLDRIQVEKERLNRSGSAIRGGLAPFHSRDVPFELPAGWSWARFGSLIYELCTGPFGSLIHKEDYVRSGIPLVNPSHMIAGRVVHDPDVTVSASMAARLSSYRLSRGDVLIARRGEVGRYALVTEREIGWICGTGSFFVRLHAEYNRRYLGLTLEDPRLRKHLLGQSVGSTMTNLNQRMLLEALIAVPPIAEQLRIVARLDELMRLCDALEEKGQIDAAQHAELLNTLLATLTDSATPKELAVNWQRVAAHFDLLLDRPEAVNALERTVVDLAVRGLLVAQNPNEEPASELLMRIRAEKDQMVVQRTINRSRPTEPVSSSEEAFPLPPGWAWLRLGDLAISNEAGWSPNCHPTPRRPGRWGVLKVSAVSWGSFDANANKELPDGLAPRVEIEVKAGDFLLSRANTEELVARSVIVVSTPPRLMLSDKVIRLNISKYLNPAFLSLSNNSSHAHSYYVARATGTSSSMKNVSREIVLAAPIAVPPVKEQWRIMARVGQLRELCAELRDTLANRQVTQTHLADALVGFAVSER